MYKYQKGYIFEGHTFVVNKSDINNAKDDQFVEASALLPDCWISVKDRLPENGERVLMCVDNAGIFEGWIMQSGAWNRSGSFVKTVFGEQSNVTHWMPLPEPPEE